MTKEIKIDTVNIKEIKGNGFVLSPKKINEMKENGIWKSLGNKKSRKDVFHER